MTLHTISEKGWIVIPADLRRKYQLKPGDTVHIVDYGGVLSIIAHLFLIIRLSKGIKLFKPFNWKGVWLPLLIYLIPAIIIVILWQDIVRVGHAAIAPAAIAAVVCRIKSVRCCASARIV